MPAKNKPSKYRTSNNKANKKISAPRWVIAVVLLIVVGTGAFLVYQSFASPSWSYTHSGENIICNSGYCHFSYGNGNQDGKVCNASSKRSAGRNINFYCHY